MGGGETKGEVKDTCKKKQVEKKGSQLVKDDKKKKETRKSEFGHFVIRSHKRQEEGGKGKVRQKETGKA